MLKQWFSAILLCIAASCASLQQAQTQNTTGSYIEVDNGGWSDVIVYAVVGSSTVRSRIGYVGSFTHEKIPLFGTFKDRDFVVVIHPLAGAQDGSQDWASETIHLHDDEFVDLRVLSPISFTNYGIWQFK